MKLLPNHISEKQRKINCAALTYLNMWASADRKLINDVPNDATGEAIQQLAKDYKVIRGIASKDRNKIILTNSEKGTRWREIANLVKSHVLAPEDNFIVIENLARELGQKYGSREGSNVLTSAATKFLWFSGRYSVRIYDERAKFALSLKFGAKLKEIQSYSRFEKFWADYETETLAELHLAIDGLEQHFGWSALPEMLRSEAKREMQNTWFRDRVFDQHLWAIGAPNK